ncbi:histone-fold-containing protein [Stipitochalara longipes BDJ]|nr:histone-fold-containing protein [Stipitochalara longipes BDJ]
MFKKKATTATPGLSKALKALGGKTVPAQATRRHRKKPGTKTLLEIRRYQNTAELLIPKAQFLRLIKEIVADIGGEGMRIEASAAEALQESAEALLFTEFELSNLGAIHAKRVTIQVKDMKLVQKMRLGMLGISKIGERLWGCP